MRLPCRSFLSFDFEAAQGGLQLLYVGDKVLDCQDVDYVL